MLVMERMVNKTAARIIILPLKAHLFCFTAKLTDNSESMINYGAMNGPGQTKATPPSTQDSRQSADTNIPLKSVLRSSNGTVSSSTENEAPRNISLSKCLSKCECFYCYDSAFKMKLALFPVVTKGKLCCITPSLCLLIVGLVFFSLWCHYNATNHLIFSKSPPTDRRLVGSNTTNLLHCYDPALVKAVDVTVSSLSNYHTNIYVMSHSELSSSVERTYLKEDTRSFVRSPVDNPNYPINYYYGDIPVYVATHGNLTYTMTATGSDSDSLCGIRLYLFQEKENYEEFRDSTDTSSPAHFEQRSECFPTQNDTATYDFNFLVTDGDRFYYVAAFIDVNVQVDITMGGYLTAYNVTGRMKECSLDSDNQKCSEISISGTKAVPTLSQDQVCILSSTDETENRMANVTVTHVIVNSLSLAYTVLWPVCIFVSGGIAVTLLIVYCCRK